MMDKHIIALTGGVGSGKSRILELLKQEYRAEIIQTDLVAKNWKGQENQDMMRL